MFRTRARVWAAFAAIAAIALPHLAAGAEPDDAERLPRIAVLRFSAPEASEWWLTQGDGAARDIFSRRLEESGRFEVVDREELDRVAIEEGLVDRGELSPAAAVKAGRILDVDYVVGGALTEYTAVIPGLVKRGLGTLPGLSTGRRTFVTAFSARLWSSARGRMLWSDEVRVETPISKDRASELDAGESDPAATFREQLEPVLTGLAERLATEPALPGGS